MVYRQTDCVGNINTCFFSIPQMFLSVDLGSGCRPRPHQKRPAWASHNPDYPASKDSAKNLSRSSHWNAGIRPGPVRLAVPALSRDALRVSQRTQRSAPSKTPETPHPNFTVQYKQPEFLNLVVLDQIFFFFTFK